MSKILSEIEYCSRVCCVGVKLKEAPADIIIKELYAHDQAQRDIGKELAIFKCALDKACVRTQLTPVMVAEMKQQCLDVAKKELE